MKAPRLPFSFASSLLLAGSLLLLQGCSKESKEITPLGSQVSTSNNTQADLRINAVSGGQGQGVRLNWVVFNYGGSPASAGSATVDINGPVHLIIPHALLYSACGFATGVYNGLDFDIPSFLPVGSYTVTVTIDKPGTSLHHAGQASTAEGTLTVTQVPVTQQTGLQRAGTDSPADPNGDIITGMSFNITWPELNALSSASRLTLKNTSTNVFYSVGPTYGYPSSQNPLMSGNMEDYRNQPFYSYGVGNVFNGSLAYGTARLNRSYLPSGSYQLYLDAMTTTYTSPSSSSYISSSTLITVP